MPTHPISEKKPVEVLSVRLQTRPAKWAGCSRERWAEVMADYSTASRSHAANLAGHGWDVLLVDGRVLIAQTSCRSDAPPNFPHWLAHTPPIYPERFEVAEPSLVASLYENQGRYAPHKRLFDLPAEGAFNAHK